jgi:hypothetical protein
MAGGTFNAVSLGGSAGRVSNVLGILFSFKAPSL